MKKYFAIAAAAIAVMASCTKTELNTDSDPGQKISFEVANYVPQTKAVAPEFTSFGCRAFLHAEGVDLNSDGTVKTTTSYQEFFGSDGETVTKSTASGSETWEPSHTYYWPKGEKSFVNFVGWYGAGNGENNAPTVSYGYNSDEGVNKYRATLTWSFSNNSAGTSDANLLYADMAWRYKSNTTNTAHYTDDPVTVGVPMLFHHALAQINVKAYAYGTAALNAGSTTNSVTDDTATWTISLNNVKITSVYAGGTLTLTNDDPVTSGTPGTAQTKAWTGSWAVTGTAGDAFSVTGPVYVNALSQGAAGDVIAATCVLPQDIGNTVKLSFDMTIQTAYSAGQSNTETIHKEILLNTMGTTSWDMNTKYTYYLKVVPSQNAVLFDPAVSEEWATVSSSDQEI